MHSLSPLWQDLLKLLSRPTVSTSIPCHPGTPADQAVSSRSNSSTVNDSLIKLRLPSEHDCHLHNFRQCYRPSRPRPRRRLLLCRDSRVSSCRLQRIHIQRQLQPHWCDRELVRLRGRTQRSSSLASRRSPLRCVQLRESLRYGVFPKRLDRRLRRIQHDEDVHYELPWSLGSYQHIIID